MNSPRTRWAIGLTSAGLVGGLALGVTGFANAASPSPVPSHGLRAEHPWGAHRPGGMKGPHLRGYGGLVASVTGSTLVVRTPQGPKTITLTGSTAYYRGATKATLAAVRAGELVRVRLLDPRAAQPVAAVVTVVPAHLAGWVTAIGSDTITVTDLSGFTRTIRTTATTTYVKDGVASTRGALTVGTLVRATGTVDQDGTTLDATRVATGRPAAGKRHADPTNELAPGDRPGMPGTMMGGPTA